MGEVYQARDTRLDRIVAVKVLPQEFAVDAGRRERFEREARAVAALNHPHICSLLDVGEAASSWESADRDPIRFLVMEYLTTRVDFGDRCAVTYAAEAGAERTCSIARRNFDADASRDCSSEFQSRAAQA